MKPLTISNPLNYIQFEIYPRKITTSLSVEYRTFFLLTPRACLTSGFSNSSLNMTAFRPQHVDIEPIKN